MSIKIASCISHDDGTASLECKICQKWRQSKLIKTKIAGEFQHKIKDQSRVEKRHIVCCCHSCQSFCCYVNTAPNQAQVFERFFVSKHFVVATRYLQMCILGEQQEYDHTLVTLARLQLFVRQ